MKINYDAQVFSMVPPSSKNLFLNGIINFSLNNELSLEVSNSSNFIPDVGNIYQCDNIIHYNDDSYWHSKENGNFGEWVQIEFKNMWIKPTAIAIVDSDNIFRMRSWTVSTSKDGTSWANVNTNKDNKIFQNQKQREIFKLRSPPARFVRITQTGLEENVNDGEFDTSFRVGKVEVFGYYSICGSKCSESIPLFPVSSCNYMKRSINLHIGTMILLIYK